MAWESQAVTRLKRERAGLIKKRDELQADVDGYNGQIKKYDERISETQKRENNDAYGGE